MEFTWTSRTRGLTDHIDLNQLSQFIEFEVTLVLQSRDIAILRLNNLSVEGGNVSQERSTCPALAERSASSSFER